MPTHHDSRLNSFTTNPNDNSNPSTIGELVDNFKYNFLNREVEIVPGLTFNQYEIVKRTYYYIHNTFMSGPTDANGNKKYFYDLMTNRNDQVVKNIDLDTKNVHIKSETGNYFKSWMLSKEFMAYAKRNNFGQRLNKMMDSLPDFGTVVWKKFRNKDGDIDVKKVPLINLMNVPTVDNLEDGPVIEKALMTQSELRANDKWDQAEVDKLINSGNTVPNDDFLHKDNESSKGQQQVDEATPYYDVYEFWGEIPKTLWDKYQDNDDKKPSKPSSPTEPKKNMVSNETVYVQAIVAGLDAGVGEHGRVLYLNKAKRENFPYKDVHFRDVDGRWLGLGNYELCFPLIEKANEITNRYFNSLRISLMHIFQTQDRNYIKNVMTDLVDGDVIQNKTNITPIANESRGFTQFKEAIERIERKADKLTNSLEVVTGENLPAGTPFRLGQQQLDTANKLFQHIRENIGLFLEEVFKDWLIDDFASKINREHVLEVFDDADDLEFYFQSLRKAKQYKALKQYIMENNRMPTSNFINQVGDLARRQLEKGPKKIRVKEDYYKYDEYTMTVVITDEKNAKKEDMETLSNVFKTIGSNPQALQDPTVSRVFNKILENAGISPIEIGTIKREDNNEQLNPANQGGANPDQQAQGEEGEGRPAEVVQQLAQARSGGGGEGQGGPSPTALPGGVGQTAG